MSNISKSWKESTYLLTYPSTGKTHEPTTSAKEGTRSKSSDPSDIRFEAYRGKEEEEDDDDDDDGLTVSSSEV